jgi:hypothetical protein
MEHRQEEVAIPINWDYFFYEFPMEMKRYTLLFMASVRLTISSEMPLILSLLVIVKLVKIL